MRPLLAALLCACPGVAAASGIAVGVYLPFGGEGGAGASLGTAFALGDALAIEARVGYHELGLDTDLKAQRRLWLDAQLLRAEALLRYDFGDGRLQPFVLAGPVVVIPLATAVRQETAGEDIAAAMGEGAAPYRNVEGTLDVGLGGSAGGGATLWFGDERAFGVMAEARLAFARAPVEITAEAPSGLGAAARYADEGRARLDGVELRFGVLF